MGMEMRMRDVLVFRLCRERSAERLVMSEPAGGRPEFPSKEGLRGVSQNSPLKRGDGGVCLP